MEKGRTEMGLFDSAKQLKNLIVVCWRKKLNAIKGIHGVRNK